MNLTTERIAHIMVIMMALWKLNMLKIQMCLMEIVIKK